MEILMRKFAGLCLLVVVCTGMLYAQDSTQTAVPESGVQLPGVTNSLAAGMTPEQFKAALKPLECKEGSLLGVGIFMTRVWLGKGAYILTLSTKDDRLAMLVMASADTSGTTTDDSLRSWFDGKIAAMPMPVHRTEKGDKGEPREVWLNGKTRWMKEIAQGQNNKTVPVYIIEFTTITKD